MLPLRAVGAGAARTDTDMTRKPAAVEYDESMVEKIDYVPAKHEKDGHCWSGGFFVEGRRNAYPAGSDGDPFFPGEPVAYAGLDVPAGVKACAGCQRLLPTSAFSPNPSKHGVLRSRCDRCLERAKRKRDATKRS